PELDIPRADELAARLLSACTPDPWDEVAWERCLDDLAEGVARRLVVSPARWGQAMHLLTIYLDNAWITGEHPQKGSRSRRRRGSEPRFNVPLGLAIRVARASLLRWSSSERITVW